MALSRIALVFSLLAVGSTSSPALTLGELVDQGAQRLTPAEARDWPVLQVIREGTDSDARMTLYPDGTVSGTVRNKQGHGSSEAAGAWTLDATGRRCVDVELPAFRMTWSECGYAWRLGSQLYHVASDSDRSAPATPYLATAVLRP